MAKDPAFLFMSKDWIEGTAEFMPDEKGVFIDLLCHQHQKGDLPNDTLRLARMVGLSHEDFLRIWKALQPKFKQVGDRLVNRRLEETMTDRSKKGWKNTITGTFASLLRLGNYSSVEYKFLKKKFNIDEFINENKETITDRLTEWIQLCLKSIGNGTVNGNVIVNVNEKGGVGEKQEIIMPYGSEEFLHAWGTWKKYREQIKKPYKNDLSEQAALKQLSTFDEEFAIKLIETSIANNYQGLVFPNTHGDYLKSKSSSGGIIGERASQNARMKELNEKYYGNEPVI